MKYEDLTILQRIGLKGLFQTDKRLYSYRMIWILWDFKKAVEFFLNDDINILQDDK